MTFNAVVAQLFAKAGVVLPDHILACFGVSKNKQLTISKLPRAKMHDHMAVRSWLFEEAGIAISPEIASAVLSELKNTALSFSDSQQQDREEDDFAINREVLVEGLVRFFVAVGFGPRAKVAVRSMDNANELRVVDKLTDANLAMSPARNAEFTAWFRTMFSSRNLPRMKGFLQMGYSYDSPPPAAAWLGLDKMEQELTGLLQEAGAVIPAERIKGISWSASDYCFYNPVARGHIPCWIDEFGKIQMTNRQDGKYYGADGVPEAWEVFESRMHPADREFWRVQVFTIFAPLGLRGRQAIWGRSSGGVGQSTIQRVLFRHMGAQHSASAPQSTWIKNWKHQSADVWNKSLIVTPDVKDVGVGLMRNDVFHQFTGGDLLRVEPKFGSSFEAAAWGKVWITSNEYPNIEVGAQHAMDRLALFELGDASPECKEREYAVDESGNPIIGPNGKRMRRPDFEERLSSQLLDYLGCCALAWWTATYKMQAAPSVPPSHMYKRIRATCGSTSHLALESRFSEYFELGNEFETSSADITHILKAWSKNDPSMTHGFPGFAKWVEALAADNGIESFAVEHRKGAHTLVGVRFKGEIVTIRGKTIVKFPDNELGI